MVDEAELDWHTDRGKPCCCFLLDFSSSSFFYFYLNFTFTLIFTLTFTYTVDEAELNWHTDREKPCNCLLLNSSYSSFLYFAQLSLIFWPSYFLIICQFSVFCCTFTFISWWWDRIRLTLKIFTPPSFTFWFPIIFSPLLFFTLVHFHFSSLSLSLKIHTKISVAHLKVFCFSILRFDGSIKCLWLTQPLLG